MKQLSSYINLIILFSGDSAADSIRKSSHLTPKENVNLYLEIMNKSIDSELLLICDFIIFTKLRSDHLQHEISLIYMTPIFILKILAKSCTFF